MIKFKGIDKVEEAELLRNSYLKVNRNDEPNLEDGTYYIVDLLGLDVYSDEGNLLGKVDDIFNNGSCDIYAVKDELGKQLLLPAISDVIKEINLEEKRIVVHILKGLMYNSTSHRFQTRVPSQITILFQIVRCVPSGTKMSQKETSPMGHEEELCNLMF